MTTPIPTSDGVTGLLPGAAGLPDENTLSQLASLFFSALPGTAPDIPRSPADAALIPNRHTAGRGQDLGLNLDKGVVPAVPATSQTPAPSSAFSSQPRHSASLQPLPVDAGGTDAAAATQAATQAPQPPTHASTQLAPEVPGSPLLYAAALPQVGGLSDGARGLPGSVPTSPFYFLSEANAQRTPAAPIPLPAENRVTPQAFGLPGERELAALLGAVDSKPPAGGVPSAGRGAPGFYFLDAVPTRESGGIPQEPHPAFDVNAVRRDFPILSERVNGRQLIWLDNAATTHKPQAVIDRLAWFYAHENSNIHRAAHELAARATDAYEGARNKVAKFLGAGSAEEIVFVRGATEAINLVAKSWGRQHIREGDEIIVSHLEHHANIVPWQQLAQETGAVIRVIPVDDSGQLLLEEYQRLLNDRTKLVAVTQVSNALGTITPIKAIVDGAHSVGAKALVDGAQAVSHLRVNVQALDADFYVFSGHKIFGPTGIGVLYGKRDILEATQPWQGGGNMIADVTFDRTVYQPAPARFEAGTGNIADAVGLGAALDYLERIGLENVARYEHDLLEYATRQLIQIPGLRMIGTAAEKTSVMSFVLDGYRTEQVGAALNKEGIAVRSGHHCAQPILRRFGVEATVRPSLAFYNTCGEIDLLVQVVRQLSSARSSR